jgi:alanyl aminopeptidase
MAGIPKAIVAMWLVGCGASHAPVPSSAAAGPPSGATVVTGIGAPLPPPRADGRLPPEVKPTHYRLELAVDPSKTGFYGRALIGIGVEQPTRYVIMHARGMTIRSAMLSSSRGKQAARPNLRMSAGSKGEAEELVLAFDQPLPIGRADVEIEYEARFAEGLRGLYRVDEGGRAYAFTQFEPNDARRAFPCFDEPAYKTPFELAITVPQGSIAFSNSDELRRIDSSRGDLVTFEFGASRPLPTYLVAFGVGPLDVLLGPKKPAPVRLVAAKGKAGLGKLSVDAAAAHLDLLGQYFDRVYPYSKLDIAAVPNFGAGAMENPGFVTFREELLLLDPQHASTSARRAMASVMAHELAHQWFGDLVTMQWWDDLWLNEAFASWMSDKIVDQWRPESRARVQSIGAKSQVMSEDALATARKIRNPVRSTSEAEEAFDGITYGKGRAVLNMTEAWLGEDVFRDGLRRYVKKHEWGNATASDLYSALAEASGRDVAKVMDTFTDQTGVPLVTASMTCPSNVVKLHQEEYRTLDRKERSDKSWRIPVCITYDEGTKLERQCTLLERADGEMALSTTARCPMFIYPNAEEAGYYRIKLAREDVKRLAGSWLGKLSEQERSGVVSNAWAQVLGGDLPASDFLELLGNFRKETSRLVWGQIVDSLAVVDRALVSETARPAFARFVRDLLGPAGRRIGWLPKPGESDDQRLLRDVILGALGALGNDDWVLSEAKRVANAWLEDPTKVDADLARSALPLAAKRGDAALFDRLVATLKMPKTPEVRVLALAGLTGFEDPALIERVLLLTLDGTVKTQDFRYVLSPLGSRRPTRDVTYAWMEKHFEELTKVMPAFLRARLIHVAAAMCTRERVHEVDAFLRPRIENLEGAEKNTRQSIEEGLRCAALAEKEGAATSTWLAKRR